VPLKVRAELALKAFAHTAAYDAAILAYFRHCPLLTKFKKSAGRGSPALNRLPTKFVVKSVSLFGFGLLMWRL